MFTKVILSKSGCYHTFSQLQRIWTDLSYLIEPATAQREAQLAYENVDGSVERKEDFWSFLN